MRCSACRGGRRCPGRSPRCRPGSRRCSTGWAAGRRRSAGARPIETGRDGRRAGRPRHRGRRAVGPIRWTGRGQRRVVRRPARSDNRADRAERRGKTSTFDACSGLNRRYTGNVLLHGEDVGHLPPAARARHGAGRTFQRMELCDTLEVMANVVLGRECNQAGANPLKLLAASPAEWHDAQAAAWAALELCGIADLADRPAGALSTGSTATRRVRPLPRRPVRAAASR